ncbi:MAG: hypothetical protein M1817_000880 [Caeruleum heppii]|nr:MAG: hypothetical protein M1817_000880 [Caeruleum heppii]
MITSFPQPRWIFLLLAILFFTVWRQIRHFPSGQVSPFYNVNSTYHTWRWGRPPIPTKPAIHNTSSPLVQFWKEYSHLLAQASPNCSPPLVPYGATINGFNAETSAQVRAEIAQMPSQNVEEMKRAHQWFVEEIISHAPSLPYTKGSRGIVTTAGSDYFPVFVVSLRMLRRTGSKLPVEVFLDSQAEYEAAMCEDILPSLNAKCIVLSDIMLSVPQRNGISRYQLKIFAMLFSSFDHMLFMDADNVALENPDELFIAEPFTSRGLVTWPDYWESTASPLFYEISSQPVPDVSTRASTESGQLMLSKSTHTSTLLLAAYYNYYGPKYFYPLLSQGAIGEGDKETFLAAALALNASFYSVEQGIETLGYRSENDDVFHGTSMVQHNPIDDYARRTRLHDSSIDTPPPPTPKPIRRLFVHVQMCKLNAAALPQKYRQEIKQRMWGPREGMQDRFGRDLERLVWDELVYTGCELEDHFVAWRDKKGVCTGVRATYRDLFDEEARIGGQDNEVEGREHARRWDRAR